LLPLVTFRVIYANTSLLLAASCNPLHHYHDLPPLLHSLPRRPSSPPKLGGERETNEGREERRQERSEAERTMRREKREE